MLIEASSLFLMLPLVERLSLADALAIILALSDLLPRTLEYSSYCSLLIIESERLA
jgi:hypothetical protein